MSVKKFFDLPNKLLPNANQVCPSRGLLRDYTTSPMDRFAALVIMAMFSDVLAWMASS